MTKYDYDPQFQEMFSSLSVDDADSLDEQLCYLLLKFFFLIRMSLMSCLIYLLRTSTFCLIYVGILIR